MRTAKRIRLPILLLALLCAAAAHADSRYAVTLDTTPLVGQGQFTLDFQFLDGTGLADDLNNNAVALSSFAFGGGSALGAGIGIGGASGDPLSGVRLRDSSFFNAFLQDFRPGALLSFDVSVTNVFNPSAVPDLFTLAILDSAGLELPTAGDADEFLAISLEGGVAPVVTVAASRLGAPFQIGPPAIVPSVPEPSSGTLLLAGMALGSLRRRCLRAGRELACS